MKGILFAAYFVNIIAAYLSYHSSKKHNNRLSSTLFIIAIAHLIIATIFTLNLLMSATPWITNIAPLLWFLLIFGVVIELWSLVKKNAPGQFLAAAIHLFLVLPTIFTIGLFILLLAIAELLIAFIIFYRNRQQYK